MERQVERWFLKRGIPHFIHGYNATEDVFTRALPLFALVFMGEVVVATDTSWTAAQNVAAFAGGIGLLAGGYALLNRWRDRPAFAVPDSIGTVELTAFVVLPSLLPLVIGGRVTGALLTAGFNIATIIVAYAVLGFGLVPMLRWAGAHTIHQLGGLIHLMARSLPLVLVFSMFIFLNAELWQVANDFTGPFFWTSLAVLACVGSLFVLLRLPREVETLRRFASWDDVAASLEGTPLSPDLARAQTGTPDPPSLSRADWLNVGLVWVFSQGVQILLVGTVIGLFYAVFGTFTVREQTIDQWTQGDIDALWRITDDLIVTSELVKVAGFIAAFSALQFAVSAVTDDAYRAEFLGELVSEVREAFAVRVLYLHLLDDDQSRSTMRSTSPPP